MQQCEGLWGPCIERGSSAAAHGAAAAWLMREYETIPGAVPPGSVVSSIELCCIKATAAVGTFAGALGDCWLLSCSLIGVQQVSGSEPHDCHVSVGRACVHVVAGRPDPSGIAPLCGPLFCKTAPACICFTLHTSCVTGQNVLTYLMPCCWSDNKRQCCAVMQ